MSEKRIFTCQECGHTFSVSDSSAGETMPCPNCQKSITLPTLGELRQLPVFIDPSTTVDKTKSVTERDRRVGLIVLLGAIALVFIGMAIWFGIPYWQTNASMNAQQYSDWNVFETWNKWQFLRPGVDTPLTETEQNIFYTLRIWHKWIVIYLSVAGVCLAGIVYLWVAPYQKREARNEKRETTGEN